jgi:very-short-patch-repair endonuclease
LKRDRLLREAGYKLVHVTWAEVLHQPQRVVDRILGAFEATTPY